MVNPAAADYTLALIFSRLATLGNEPAQTNADSVVKHARYHLESILEWALWADYLRKNPAKFISAAAHQETGREKYAEGNALITIVPAQRKSQRRAKLTLILFLRVVCSPQFD